MDSGDISMGKYAFTKMEEAIIKNTESVHSKGFIIFSIPFFLTERGRVGITVKLRALFLQSMNCRNTTVKI